MLRRYQVEEIRKALEKDIATAAEQGSHVVVAGGVERECQWRAGEAGILIEEDGVETTYAFALRVELVAVTPNTPAPWRTGR